MKSTTIFSILSIILLSSCTTVYYTKNYEDANYLAQDEFADYNDYESIEEVEIEEDNVVISDTSEDGSVVNNYYGDYYEADDYYDFSYSARIRRFHRPVWSVGYYGGLYTDYYWYSYNPYHCGTSIYYGYNYYNSFYSPYYSWGYSPYYSYYSPYYYGYNHHHNHYGYQNYNDHVYSYNNSYDANSYSYGPRGSLSSRGNTNRSVKSVVISENSSINSTYNKFNQVVDKKISTQQIENNSKNTINTTRGVSKINSSKISTNRTIKNSTYKTNKTNSKNNNYKSSKSNRSYNKSNSRGSSTRSSGNKRESSSNRSGKKSVKPRN